MVRAMKRRKTGFKSPKTFSGKPFEGILLEPISMSFVPSITGANPEIERKLNGIADDERSRANRQLLLRLHALLEHYEIGDGETGAMQFSLVLALARDFLPGFQLNLQPPETRPKGSYTVGGESLFNAINNRRESKGGTIKDACVYLARDGRGRWKNEKAKALETAYHRYKSECRVAYRLMQNHAVYSELIRLLGIEELFRQMKKSAKQQGLILPIDYDI